MAQESKRLIVKRLGAPGTVAVDLLPWETAADVLRKSGAGGGFVLSPAPQEGILFAAEAELWETVVSGQMLYAVQPRQGC